jgi:hypothetical protein
MSMTFPLVKVSQLPPPDLWLTAPALQRESEGQHLADL